MQPQQPQQPQQLQVFVWCEIQSKHQHMKTPFPFLLTFILAIVITTAICEFIFQDFEIV